MPYSACMVIQSTLILGHFLLWDGLRATTFWSSMWMPTCRTLLNVILELWTPSLETLKNSKLTSFRIKWDYSLASRMWRKQFDLWCRALTVRFLFINWVDSKKSWKVGKFCWMDESQFNLKNMFRDFNSYSISYVVDKRKIEQCEPSINLTIT